MVRMSDAATQAAKALSRARWGSQRVDKLAAELLARADELSEHARDQLRAEFSDHPDTTMETRYR